MSSEPSSSRLPPAASNCDDVPWERVEKFLGQFSHDIRNGLNACELQLSFLSEISSEPEAAAEIKQLRGTLAGIARQLQSLRVSTGTVTAHTLSYPAADLFEDLRERFARLQPELAKRITWNIAVAPEILVTVDPELTLSACLELLDNACYFADAGTPVICALQAGGELVWITFHETFGGSPSNAPANWGRAPLISTRRGAYGLGLFRARKALAAQGANLDFRYSSEEKTVAATITLRGDPSPALP